MVRDSKFFVRFAPEACMLAALILLVIPLKWVLAWIAAALWHELFHCLALLLCGKPVHGLTIGINGAQISTDILSDSECLICGLAGPVGGLLLLFLSGLFPRLAVCALLQSVFNLMPVYPLDGGLALRGLTRLLLPERWARGICTAVEIVVVVFAVCFGLALHFHFRVEILPAILIVCFLVQMKKRKIPCK